MRLGVVRIAGATLRCPEALMGQTEILLRPEDIALQATNGDAGAEVTRRVFLGERLQLQLRTADQAMLVCDAAKQAPWQPGDRVQLSIAPDHLMPALES